jgi:hypothetical protein
MHLPAEIKRVTPIIRFLHGPRLPISIRRRPEE